MKQVLFQKRIYREDLQANPDVLYVFGDNLKRVGLGGQAKEMRGEPNAIGVATKRAPDDLTSSFFYDNEFEEVIDLLWQDFKPITEALLAGKTVVFPLDGLGTGLSRLPETAPKVDRALKTMIADTAKAFNREA